MNARSPEGDPSNQPDERHIEGGPVPSLELLDTSLEKTRMWSTYFDKIIEERYPIGGRDSKSSSFELAQNKRIATQLHVYEHEISSKKFVETIATVRELIHIDPNLQSFNNELTPHIINRHIMSTLYRSFVSSQYALPDETDIKTAQVLLALESNSIHSYQKSLSHKDGAYLDKQLLDIDAMIMQLRYSVEADQRGVSGIMVLPNPHVDSSAPIRSAPEFLVFIPNESSGYDIRDASTERTLGKNATPGDVASNVLLESSVRQLALRPEFKDFQSLDRVVMARRAIKETFSKK